MLRNSEGHLWPRIIIIIIIVIIIRAFVRHTIRAESEVPKQILLCTDIIVLFYYCVLLRRILLCTSLVVII